MFSCGIEESGDYLAIRTYASNQQTFTILSEAQSESSKKRLVGMLEALAPKDALYNERMCSEGYMRGLPKVITFNEPIVQLILVTNAEHDGFGFEATYQFMYNPRMFSDQFLGWYSIE